MALLPKPLNQDRSAVMWVGENWLEAAAMRHQRLSSSAEGLSRLEERSAQEHGRWSYGADKGRAPAGTCDGACLVAPGHRQAQEGWARSIAPARAPVSGPSGGRWARPSCPRCP